MARIIRIVWGTLINSAVAVSAAHVLMAGVFPYVGDRAEATEETMKRSLQELADEVYRIRGASTHLK